MMTCGRIKPCKQSMKTSDFILRSVSLPNGTVRAKSDLILGTKLDTTAFIPWQIQHLQVLSNTMTI